MEALRMIKKPNRRKITITLPKSFGDDPVEVIILPVDAGRQRPTQFNPEDYYGIGRSNLSFDQIDDELRKLRNEWERDI
ncbi:MAG: hypothetical protein HUU32_21735 [Calditrichaceae bacterium]|nr:hypothetical protein [Calditrichia bacterium]NUQ44018.1 hypothetical protein [Calditrichaceae bacterium]